MNLFNRFNNSEKDTKMTDKKLVEFENKYYSEVSNFKSSRDGLSESYTHCTFTNVSFKEYPVRESTFDRCVFISCEFTPELIEKFSDNCTKINCRVWSVTLKGYVNDITQ